MKRGPITKCINDVSSISASGVNNNLVAAQIKIQLRISKSRNLWGYFTIFQDLRNSARTKAPLKSPLSRMSSSEFRTGDTRFRH